MGMGVAARSNVGNAVPPTGARVRVQAMEIVQSIQDAGNRVPLIKGKPTLVRVFIDASALDEGIELHGEIAVSASPGGPALFVPSINSLRSTKGVTTSNVARADLAASLNFALPAPALAWDHVSVTVSRIHSPTGDVPHHDEPPLTLAMRMAPPLRIKAIGLRYAWVKPDGTTAQISPTAADFEHLRSFLVRAYPVGNVDWSQLVVQAHPLIAPPFSGSTQDGDDDVWRSKLDLAHNQLAALRAKDVDAGTDPRTHYYGLISDANEHQFFRGAAKDVPQTPDPSVVAVGPAGDPSQYGGLRWDTGRTYAGWYGAHEIGHTFGRFHPGFCGQDASDKAFPYPEGRISGGAAGDAIGVDLGDPVLGLPMRVLGSDHSHDVMTYCDYQWVSSYTYEAILDRLVQEDALLAPVA